MTKAPERTSARTRRVDVKIFRPGNTITGVHILFVGHQPGALAKLREIGAMRGVLTVTEVPGGLAAGSAMNFLIVDERVRFDVSLPNAERSGLKISARLLALANQVETAKP